MQKTFFLIRAEASRWFRGKGLLLNLAIWTAVVNAMPVLMLLGSSTLPDDFNNLETLSQMFMLGYGMFAGIGVMVLMQNSFLTDLDQGTMAWILSKPFTRTAYLLAKFSGTAVPATLFISLLQGIIGFLILSAAFPELELLQFVQATVIVWFSMILYLVWSLFISIITQKSVAAVAVIIVTVFIQQPLIAVIPSIASLLPLAQFNEAVTWLNGSQHLFDFAIIPVILIEIVILLSLSVWKFRHYEF